LSSGPAGIYYRETQTLRDTLGTKPQLSHMLKNQNLLEDDGIEDLHFYFVEFNQHKRLIVRQQRCRSNQGVRERSNGQD